MTLPIRKHLGRRVPDAHGRRVYAVDCCSLSAGTTEITSLPVGKFVIGRRVPDAHGRRVYATSCCLPTGIAPVFVPGRRVYDRLGRRVYAFAEPCCEGLGGSSGASARQSSSGGVRMVVDCNGDTIPATLYFTISGGCASCFGGLTIPLTDMGFLGGGFVWIGCVDVACGSTGHCYICVTLSCDNTQSPPLWGISVFTHTTIACAPTDHGCSGSPYHGSLATPTKHPFLFVGPPFFAFCPCGSGGSGTLTYTVTE